MCSLSFPSGIEESTLLGAIFEIGLIGGSDLEVGVGTPLYVCVSGLIPSGI